MVNQPANKTIPRGTSFDPANLPMILGATVLILAVLGKGMGLEVVPFFQQFVERFTSASYLRELLQR